MGKKNKELKTIDAGIAYEAQKQYMNKNEYVNSCLKELMVSYPSLRNFDLKAPTPKTGDELWTPRPWPCLEDMLRIKQYSSQEEMAKVALDFNNEYPAPFYVTFFDHYECRDMRYYDGPVKDYVGHTIVSMIPMGDKSSCERPTSHKMSFESPKDDRINGLIIAGKTEDGTYRAFLVVESEDGAAYEEDDCRKYYIFSGSKHLLIELESFSILSLLDKNYANESGVITVFSHARKILHTEKLTGYPDLRFAYASYPSNDDVKDDGKVTHKKETAPSTESTESKKEEVAASTD